MEQRLCVFLPIKIFTRSWCRRVVLVSVQGKVRRPICWSIRVGLCELVNRYAEAANNENWDAKALGLLCRVVEHLFQCSDVRLVSHKVS
jgi:hypothetical protein